MKRVDRYVLREILPPFIMAFMIVVVMFQVNFYMALARDELTRNVPILATIKIIFLETPGFLNLTLPISVALSTSLALSRLARESEITAMRAAGASVKRIVRPALAFGLIICLLNFYSISVVTPAASKQSYQLKTSSSVLAGMGTFASNRPLRLGNYTVSIGSLFKTSEESLGLRDTLLIDRTDPERLIAVSAKEGEYARGVWRFKDTLNINVKTGSTTAVVSKSKELILNQKVSLRDLMNLGTGVEELSIPALREQIDLKIKAGANVSVDIVALHNKFSIPLMSLIFAFVTPLFAIKMARYGAFIGVLISMVVVMVYYNLWVVCTIILPKTNAIPPTVLAWIPDLIFAIAGLFAYRSLE